MAKEKGLPETAPEEVNPIDSIVIQGKKKWDMLLKAKDVELAGPLAKSMINIFVAKNNSGKSLLAFCIAWKELRGKNFTHVFYLDLDNPEPVVKERYSPFPYLPGLLYLTQSVLLESEEIPGILPTDKAWYLLENLPKRKYVSTSLVVVDSLQNMVDYNNKQEVGRLFNACRSITLAGGTVLVLHHKSAKEDSPRFKGLSLIQDFPDVMWEVIPQKKRTGEVGEITSFRLVCSKNRSTMSFANFNVSINTEQLFISYDQNVLLEEELPIKEAVLTVLRGKKEMKQADIVEITKQRVSDSGKTIGEKKIRNILGKLAALHILNVRTVKTAKLYSINYNSIEPGYWDAVEDDIPDDDKVVLPF